MKAVFLWALCLIFTTPILTQAQTAETAPTCINDKDGKKGATSQAINKAIYLATDPLAMAFSEYYGHANRCEPDATETPLTFAKAFKLLGDLAESVTKPSATFIKKECVEASLQRDIDQKGYTCEGNTAKEFNNSAEGNTPCLNRYSVDYIHFSVNLALKCFATLRDPIDARFLLKKINTETGFNFFLGSSGGVGMGQLTRWPVKEIAGQKKLEGNARQIFEDLAKSEDPACKPFKQVVEADLKTPPPIPPINHVCKYVSTNDGLARNLAYGLGYFIYNRDEVIKPFLRQKNISKDLVRSKELVNYATLLSYGPDGPEGAKAFMDSNRFKKGTVDQGIRALKSADYVNTANERYKSQLLPFFKPGEEPSNEDLKGSSCVTN